MASTEEAREHALGAEHLAGCLALSMSARWNQNEADWRLMLEIGHGWGITLADGTLAASTLVLPYGSFAWVSMVLVLPEHRRKGYATQLLRRALDELGKRGLTPILDATPAGHEVYMQEGFRDTWGFRRYALHAAPKRLPHDVPAGMRIRPLVEGDWPHVLALDSPAFGASRERLLRALARRMPEAALVAERSSALCGYLLGREGREARQLGPLVAADANAAKALAGAVLPRLAAPVYIDIVDRHADFSLWAEALGFEFQRPFTRMVHGGDRAPGDNATMFLVAGPELG